MNLNIKKELNKSNKKREKKKSNYKWIIEITLIAFIISFLFSSLSEIIIPKVDVLIGVVILLFFIMIGILFDMIGVAVTASDLSPFNSMSSRKVKGAKTAVKLKQNADKVSSFCNDVIGDICGIISGSAGAIVSLAISTKLNIDLTITTLLVMAIVASLTIGGKALGKSVAINKSNNILYRFAKTISIFNKKDR